MKQQFDKDIRDTLAQNLDQIHASDDLIAKTLQRLREEGHISDNENNTGMVLTAIDSSYVADHVKNTRRTKTGKLILALAAASVMLISCIALKCFTDNAEIDIDDQTQTEAEHPAYQCCIAGGPDYYNLSREAASAPKPGNGYEKLPRGNAPRHSSVATGRTIG
jgi:fructose-1,6-bisphosphatase/sedoheptulose 1,7-bisphosphatase-like protein